MMTRFIDDESLLAQLRDWLRQTRAEGEGTDGNDAPVDAAEPVPQLGLYRLVEEFTALRHEVKLQTKSARGLQEESAALLPAMRQAIEAFRSVAPKEEQAAFVAARPLAEALADLDEALARSRVQLVAFENRIIEDSEHFEAEFERRFANQSWFRRMLSRKYHERLRSWIQERGDSPTVHYVRALVEGHDLIQGRLRRAMEAEQVRRIECVGAAVDPERMTVIDVVGTSAQPPGHVVEELRPGYTWRGRVLRFAEVRAASISSSITPEGSD
jgi:molecular chaperone GrpE